MSENHSAIAAVYEERLQSDCPLFPKQAARSLRQYVLDEENCDKSVSSQALKALLRAASSPSLLSAESACEELLVICTADIHLCEKIVQDLFHLLRNGHELIISLVLQMVVVQLESQLKQSSKLHQDQVGSFDFEDHLMIRTVTQSLASFSLSKYAFAEFLVSSNGRPLAPIDIKCRLVMMEPLLAYLHFRQSGFINEMSSKEFLSSVTARLFEAVEPFGENSAYCKEIQSILVDYFAIFVNHTGALIREGSSNRYSLEYAIDRMVSLVWDLDQHEVPIASISEILRKVFEVILDACNLFRQKGYLTFRLLEHLQQLFSFTFSFCDTDESGPEDQQLSSRWIAPLVELMTIAFGYFSIDASERELVLLHRLLDIVDSHGFSTPRALILHVFPIRAGLSSQYKKSRAFLEKQSQRLTKLTLGQVQASNKYPLDYEPQSHFLAKVRHILTLLDLAMGSQDQFKNWIDDVKLQLESKVVVIPDTDSIKIACIIICARLQLMTHDLVAEKDTIESLLELCHSIARKDSPKGMLLLGPVMDFANKCKDPQILQMTLCSIPAFASKSSLVSPILRIIETIVAPFEKSEGKHSWRNFCVGLQMLFGLYARVPKTFPILKRKIEYVFSTDNIPDQVRLQGAKCVVDVAKLCPRDGLELISIISAMIADEDAATSAMGLDALYYLCLGDEVDFMGAYSIIEDQMAEEERSCVLIKFCKFLSLSSKQDVEEADRLSMARLIWDYTLSMAPAVREAAWKSLDSLPNHSFLLIETTVKSPSSDEKQNSSPENQSQGQVEPIDIYKEASRILSEVHPRVQAAAMKSLSRLCQQSNTLLGRSQLKDESSSEKSRPIVQTLRQILSDRSLSARPELVGALSLSRMWLHEFPALPAKISTTDMEKAYNSSLKQLQIVMGELVVSDDVWSKIQGLLFWCSFMKKMVTTCTSFEAELYKARFMEEKKGQEKSKKSAQNYANEDESAVEKAINRILSDAKGYSTNSRASLENYAFVLQGLMIAGFEDSPTLFERCFSLLWSLSENKEVPTSIQAVSIYCLSQGMCQLRSRDEQKIQLILEKCQEQKLDDTPLNHGCLMMAAALLIAHASQYKLCEQENSGAGALYAAINKILKADSSNQQSGWFLSRAICLLCALKEKEPETEVMPIKSALQELYFAMETVNSQSQGSSWAIGNLEPEFAVAYILAQGYKSFMISEAFVNAELSKIRQLTENGKLSWASYAIISFQVASKGNNVDFQFIKEKHQLAQSETKESKNIGMKMSYLATLFCLQGFNIRFPSADPDFDHSATESLFNLAGRDWLDRVKEAIYLAQEPKLSRQIAYLLAFTVGQNMWRLNTDRSQHHDYTKLPGDSIIRMLIDSAISPSRNAHQQTDSYMELITAALNGIEARFPDFDWVPILTNIQRQSKSQIVYRHLVDLSIRTASLQWIHEVFSNDKLYVSNLHIVLQSLENLGSMIPVLHTSKTCSLLRAATSYVVRVWSKQYTQIVSEETIHQLLSREEQVIDAQDPSIRLCSSLVISLLKGIDNLLSNHSVNEDVHNQVSQSIFSMNSCYPDGVN
eukprot:TRINITY_DN7775_c0_g1_i2.p1 TRINITY_DN7775_c0_g1~~TRINITY_DN7775_c0_g1_i2.p1  ORF type:complete len:1557 (+),score=290.37 TRINITY_DN7775_c0_g1_i2:56-4726(+)